MADVLDKLGCELALDAMVEIDEASERQLQVCNFALDHVQRTIDLAINAMGIVQTVVQQGEATLAELDAREGR